MLFTKVIAQAFLFSLAAAIPVGNNKAKADKVSNKDDVGSLLKSMDQSKLTIPADARAVMKKMPETPAAVTTADRAAIDACLTNPAVDALGKEACAAQKDQLSVVIDKKKKVPTANMAKFTKDAMAAGAVAPPKED